MQGDFPAVPGRAWRVLATAKAGERLTFTGMKQLIGVLKALRIHNDTYTSNYHGMYRTTKLCPGMKCCMDSVGGENYYGRCISNFAGRLMDGALAHSEAATMWQ